MSPNIFHYELRAHLRSVISWSFALAALILFFFSMFPAFADHAALMKEMLSKLPRELLAAFGMENLAPDTVLGFYSMILVFVQLCLAIQASYYGFGLVSIEESEFTADFLLSKPVSRVQVLTSKMLAALASLLITNLVVWLSSFLAFTLFRGKREYEFPTLLLLLASLLIFQLSFLSIGLLISLLVKRVRNVTPYALGLAFGAYVLNGFSGILGEVKLELITPFKHFDASYIIANVSYNTPLVLLNVVVSLVALVLSYWLYLRRDIPAVS